MRRRRARLGRWHGDSRSNTPGFVPGPRGRPAEAPSCWARNTGLPARVGDTGEDVQPLREEEIGLLGLLPAEAGSASDQTGPGKGKRRLRGVPPSPPKPMEANLGPKRAVPSP